jgi:uncharacterized membrane protein
MLYGVFPGNFIPIRDYPFYKFKIITIITISLRRLAKMKTKLIAVLIVMMLAVVGCSSGGGKADTPDDKIATINTMMKAGYEMSDNQRNNINKAIEEAKKLMSQNKIDEANTLLKKTINTLELIAETDRFNKSE